MQLIASLTSLEELLVKQYNHDFNERSVDEQPEMSREDVKILEIMKNSANLTDGHYSLKLPFREEKVSMPNNRHVAEQRALCLKRKVKKNATFNEEYVNFLGAVIQKGYAERVPEQQLEDTEVKGEATVNAIIVKDGQTTTNHMIRSMGEDHSYGQKGKPDTSWTV